MKLESLSHPGLFDLSRSSEATSVASASNLPLKSSFGNPIYGDGFGHSQDFQVSALAASGHVFLGRPTSGFGARGTAFEQAPRVMAAGYSTQAASGEAAEGNALSRKCTEVLGKVMSIAEKLKAVKVRGLSNCITLVNSVAGALEAGIDGDWGKCANLLMKAGKAALSIAKTSGKTIAKVAGRSLPIVSIIVGGWGMIDSKDKANAARRKGCPTAAALWEVKGLCDSAVTAMGVIQMLSAATVALPAGIEAGILALSLVSELVADAADDSEKEEREKAEPPSESNPIDLRDINRIPVDNTRVAPPPMLPVK